MAPEELGLGLADRPGGSAAASGGAAADAAEAHDDLGLGRNSGLVRDDASEGTFSVIGQAVQLDLDVARDPPPSEGDWSS